MSDDDVTVGEIVRTLRDFRADQHMQNNATRNDMQVAIGKLENALNETRMQIAQAPYVHEQIFEEVRRSQGERIGELEKDIINVNAQLTRVSQLLWGAVVSIIVSVVAGVILAVVTMVIK